MSKKLASNNHTTGSVKRNKYLEGSESSSSSDSRPMTKRSSSSGSNNQSKQSRRAQKRKWDEDYEFPEPAMTSDSDQDWEEEKADESSSSSDSDPMWSPAQRSANLGAASKRGASDSKPQQKITLPVTNKPSASMIELSDEESTPQSVPSESTESYHAFSGLTPTSVADFDKFFESQKFIMAKSDYKTQASPCIWRIDGRNLLQKYELVKQSEGTSYHNISTYSSWSINNKSMYIPINAEFKVQTKSEIIVKFDRRKVFLPIEEDIMGPLEELASSMIDNFQIYLQTLCSQALDSNFLMEISKENDEYFLTSMAAVEDHWVLPYREKLKEITPMRKAFQDMVELHPELGLRVITSGDKKCEVCSCKNPIRSFDFRPHTYNYETLEVVTANPALSKSYRCCLACTDRVLLYHQLYHVRYHLFVQCKAKINEFDRTDGPAALTNCLADQRWKSLMHRRVKFLLAETQQTVKQYRQQQPGGS